MASVFTYDPDPPRVSSPWSLSGSSTPQPPPSGAGGGEYTESRVNSSSNKLADYGITKLESEPQEGPTEYKLHLLLRRRRFFTAMSTGQVVGGAYHFRTALPKPNSGVNLAGEATAASPSARSPSLNTRQQRLQQLTTQLLWRLQQSSPFHSSSTANLVLPVLPEATPKLGLPQKPTRLLPGLEESQGALYEIGVADDGTFVGLTPDELDESLNNLQVMAASLGCKVEVLRKVVVGTCEWTEDIEEENKEGDSVKTNSSDLWVAEALVSPDLEFYTHQSRKDLDMENLSLDESGPASKAEDRIRGGACSQTEQIRVSLTGPSAAGKSSLLGTLTSSALDNGRGKSRLSLLKHRHEISSGITSSVAQELIGYGSLPSAANIPVDVINYASGNVTAWNDIHAASDGGRLAFVSDLPGLTRYMKSTLRGLISWAPHYTVLCVPANSSQDMAATQDDGESSPEIDLCLAYLDLCIRLDVPLILCITKLDLASRLGLKQTLAKVLSAIKLADKKPLMLSIDSPGQAVDLQRISTTDCDEARKTINSINGQWSSTIPILLTSAVNGSGIGKLHAMLRFLPLPITPPSRLVRPLPSQSGQEIPTDVFDIDEVFAIPPSKVYLSADSAHSETKGVVLCGIVRHGSISIGDELVIGPIAVEAKPDDAAPQASLRSRSLQDPLNASPRPRSLRSRASPGEFSSSFSHGSFPGKSRTFSHAEWQRVRVVSVRYLRLSVRILLEDQVGTIGVEPIPWSPGREVNSLGRLRKGMILAQARMSLDTSKSTTIPSSLAFSTAFVATFPARDFSTPLSPPLILGGSVVIYIGNIRAAAKVTCVSLADDDAVDSLPGGPVDEPDFFNFDDDEDREKYYKMPRRSRPESEKTIDISSAHGHGYIDITFAFISSIEWVELGSLVVVMPGATTATSATGDSVSLSGLEGFVGRVSEVNTSEDMSER